MNNLRLSFIEHLDEFRKRLIKSLLAFGVAGVLVYNLCDKILLLLARPVGKLVFIDPTEGFVTYIKLSLWGGLFLSSPFVIYQIWQFVASGLIDTERRRVQLYAPLSFGLFLSGVAFGFFVVIRLGLQFLLSFGNGLVTPMITISRYVSFLGAMLLAFGLVFQLPLVMITLTRLGAVQPETFCSKRRYAIVLIFIAAGILTPGPDIFSQLSMAIPLLVLYEFGILLSKISFAKRDGNYTLQRCRSEDGLKSTAA